MVRIILTVILSSIFICPCCYAKCDNYYILMEKKIDDFYYSPINKNNITWSISNIHSNKETNPFDMNCVLNLHCEKVAIDMKKYIPTEFRFGFDDKYTINHEPVEEPIETEVNKTNIAIPPLEPVYPESYTSSEEEEMPDINNTMTDEEYKDDYLVHDNEFGNPNFIVTSDKNNSDIVRKEDINIGSQEEVGIENRAKSTDAEINQSNIENSTKLTSSEDIKKNKEVDEGKNFTDIENGTINIVNEGINSSSTKSSEVNLQNSIETSDNGNDVFELNNTNSSNATNNKLINEEDTMAGTNKTNIFGTDHHKYDPEKSKKVALKVMAGTLGAVTAVGAFILVKFGVSKLIDHITQYGVYRLPNP